MTLEKEHAVPIKGSCHCGNTQFEVNEAPSDVTRCTCSLCSKRGALWAYYTPAQFRLTSPPENVATYLWGSRTVKHTFCASCGCRDRLGPGGSVHIRADRRQVPVRSAELAKAQFAGMDADADPQFTCGEAVRFDEALAPLAPVGLNFARGEHGVSDMLLPLQGK